MYEDRNESGERSNWIFEYHGEDLIDSTSKRLSYHQGRRKFWDTEAEKVEKEIRDKGVSLEERGVTGGVRFEARIDAVLGQRLAECRTKSDSHRSLAEQYEAYRHEFNRNPQSNFKLRIADLKFFGLVGDVTKFGDETLS
jgi:hypothetical protein